VGTAGGITQLLERWSEGDKSALDELMPLVYDELHRLAGRHLAREARNNSLQSTAIVHEAYMRLSAQKKLSWENRVQFFGLASKLMRNILVDHARAHRAARRGGGQFRLSISKADRFNREPDVDVVALNDALHELADQYPQHAEIVELRYFGGLTIEETAEAMGLSHATIERYWEFARAWLQRELTR
jgi:RNA polymerase sigma factor (TIGR02999 family)